MYEIHKVKGLISTLISEGFFLFCFLLKRTLSVTVVIPLIRLSDFFRDGFFWGVSFGRLKYLLLDITMCLRKNFKLYMFGILHIYLMINAKTRSLILYK